ncbi:hypothetical protein ES703_37032 [subsurface metagenome]
MILALSSNGYSSEFPGLKEIVASYSFNHPASRFLYRTGGERSLHLVTGTWIYGKGSREKLYFLYMIKNIDRMMVVDMAQEIGASLAFFAGGQFICSDIPDFELPPEIRPNVVLSINTSTGRYYFLSRVLSSDIHEKVNLVVLKSTLNDLIYAGRL